MIVNTDGNGVDTINNGVRKGGAAFGMLKWILKNADLDKRIKLMLYKQLIRPAML